MAWLRIDDGFDTHPKILALGSDQRRWTWMRILVYTCRYRSDLIPSSISDLIPKATKNFLEDCVNLGLIDVASDGSRHVHDWRLYNAETLQEKVAAYLEGTPGASANDVHKAIGGKREIVLALVTQFRVGTQPVPKVVPAVVPGNQESGSLTGTRAREPVPGLDKPPFLPSPPEDRTEGRIENGGTPIPITAILKDMPL